MIVVKLENMFVEPSNISDVWRNEFVRTCTRVIHNCRVLTPVEISVNNERWNCLVCEDVSPEYIVDSYRLYTNDENIALEFRYKPSNRVLKYKEEHKAFQLDSGDKMIVMVIKTNREIDPHLWLTPFKIIEAYRYGRNAENEESLELVLNTPMRFGSYYVLGGSTKNVLLIDMNKPSDIMSISKSNIDSILMRNTYCFNPLIIKQSNFMKS